MSNDSTSDALVIDTIRALSMDAVQAANSGHPGTPMALAPLGWTIFSKLRKHAPASPHWIDRDRFVLSCGHASMLQYGLLFASGYDLSLDDIKAFRQWGSKTPGHPEFGHTVGVETTTGPLGQGIATAVGMAMAEVHLAKRFNRPGHEIIDHHTWVIASDGDVMEGVSAEAAAIAGRLELGKLIVYWDDNDITIDGRASLSTREDVCARFAAAGWHVERVDDGNDIAAIVRASEAAKKDPRPSFIRVKTIIGYPSPGKQDTSDAHGAPLGKDEISATKKVMGWPDVAFHVPDGIAGIAASVRDAGAAREASWKTAFAGYEAAHPELAATLVAAMSGELPAGWEGNLPEFPADAKGIATRKASEKTIQALAKAIPQLVGGSADLAGSNLTTMEGEADFLPEAEGIPRNVNWGIREHGMAAAVNGMALHGGVVPFGATFLIFADYMRPSLRLAALMGIPTRYVFTHDSIGLGEDGPTHQPIEHLASLRAMPGFSVFRPGDANETRECWKLMLRSHGPAAIVLTRQNLPTLDRSVFAPADNARFGAYVVAEAEGGSPDAILVGTGSELSVAIEARTLLAAEGIKARVVSMPCWELFLAQSAEYRASVFPAAVTARVVVEAGVRMGWERFIGEDGGFVTLERFGASAPAPILFRELGITKEHVAAEAKRLLGRA